MCIIVIITFYKIFELDYETLIFHRQSSSSESVYLICQYKQYHETEKERKKDILMSSKTTIEP